MKRLFDLVISLTMFFFALPIILLICIFVFIFLGYPILFSQIRAGKNEELFKLYKFRTMQNLYDENGELLDDSLRLKVFGSFLRTTSMDELPGLINVIKGDMSLVGPRPLISEYLPLYNEEQSRRHDIKPGITGWAQVNGRNNISWEKKFELDLWYIENRSFSLDIKILFLTAINVFKRADISFKNSDSTERFKGSGN
jgi:lipopolysaccharide/colanic/teichoic acid biosynthesis glycosyltransferase